MDSWKPVTLKSHIFYHLENKPIIQRENCCWGPPAEKPNLNLTVEMNWGVTLTQAAVLYLISFTVQLDWTQHEAMQRWNGSVEPLVFHILTLILMSLGTPVHC